MGTAAASFLLIAFMLFQQYAYATPFTISPTCIEHDKSSNTIFVRCDADFTEISGNQNSYVLNSDVVVQDDATLSISDLWLKIADQHTITVKGMIMIDGTKITSWSNESNSEIVENAEATIPRASILLDASEGGHIRNSEIAYLGYDIEKVGFGGLELQKFTRDVEISNNNFHHMYFALYSNRASNITIDGNDYHDNLLYALDPHTETENMNITNNKVHDNAGFGIICSLDCSDILIQNNTVYNNGKAGIMLSRNTSNSVVSDNTVYNQSKTYGIFVSASPNNHISDNVLNKNSYGIYVKESSTGNIIENNIVNNSKRGLVFANSSDNIARNNTIGNISAYAYFLDLGADLTIDKQDFTEPVEIRGAEGNNSVTIQNSGVIRVNQQEDVFNTDKGEPFSRALSNTTIGISR